MNFGDLRVYRIADDGARALEALLWLDDESALSLAGLITHTCPAADAPKAYETAFTDASCLKMILDWKGHA